MEFRRPSWKDMYPVHRENLDAARKYVDAVTRRLRRDILVQGIGRANLQSPDNDCSAWQLRSGTIWGLEHIGHDGRPWPLKAPLDSGDVDDDGSPEHFDVAAVVLLHDVGFEASYNYTSPTQTVCGRVSGKIDTVRLDMKIVQEPDGVPEVIWFKVMDYTPVRLSENSVGLLNEKLIIAATEKVLHTCIEDAMSYHVLPVLSNLLKTIPYPDFT